MSKKTSKKDASHDASKKKSSKKGKAKSGKGNQFMGVRYHPFTFEKGCKEYRK